MSPTNSDHTVTENTNIDQTMFLLEIVGGVVFVLLIMLCFLVHYFRRKCMKPRQLFKKLQFSAAFRSATTDQSTSTSNLSLVVSQSESEILSGNMHSESSGHEEVVMVDVHVNQGCSLGEADMHTPVLQHTYSTSQEFSPREESLSHKENDQRCISLENMATFFTNGRKSLEETEGFGSPEKDEYRHSFNAMSSQSLLEKHEQASFQVELSISPQVQSQHLAAQAISLQHLQEAGTGDWKPQHVVMSESISIPPSLSAELLTKKGLAELGGSKPLPHPEAWFVTLDGRPNAQVRHSYIDLQKNGKNGINNPDSGNGMNERKQQVQLYPQRDLDEDLDQSGSECGTAVCSPENNTPGYVLDGGRRRRDGQLPSLQEETKRSVESPPEPLPNTERKTTRYHEVSCDSSDGENANCQMEGKKTPWQKREERPVLAFDSILK